MLAPAGQALWVNTVTRAQLINVLDDDVGPLSTENGSVVLDLQPLVIQLRPGRSRRQCRGAVCPDAGRVEIMEADQLETAGPDSI
jgi:hypothetical protein